MDSSAKQNRYGWSRWGLILGVLLLPWLVQDYYLYYVNLALIYVIVAMGLNMVLGYAGMIHLGFAGLFGIGAYATAASLIFLNIGLLPSILMGGLTAAVAGYLLAVPAVRLSEIGFALVSLAFGEAIISILGNIEVIGGYNGIQVSDPSVFGISLAGNTRFFYFCYPITLALLIACINIMKSRYGRAIMALHDSSIGAQSMGVNINGYKVLISVIAAFYAGVGGGLFVPLVNFIDPGSFGIGEILLILMMVIIGGMGTHFGPILGAVLLSFMPELVREFKEYSTLVYGVTLVLIIIFLPEGIWGSMLELKNRLKRQQ